MVFDNFPRYSSAAEVVEVDESGVSLKVLEGNPLLAGTHFYCANLWDPNTRMLKHVESLTYGGDAKTAEFEVKILDAKKGLARLDSPKIAQRVKVGDLVSWCFGYNGMQVSFEKCDNLYVENVHTLNAVGFCMNTSESENVRSKGVKFTAPDNQLMVCSRDAWKSYANTGEVVMEDMFIEKAYSDCIKISIDYGVMEKAENVYMLCVDFGWADLGTWGSLYDIAEKDEHQNAPLKTRTLMYESSGNIIALGDESRLAVIQGLHDYIIAESGNVLLICKREDEQRIKQFVADAQMKYEKEFN